MIEDFKDFDAFKKCRALVRRLAPVLLTATFRRDQVLIMQMRKSMLSIYANFGEGFERNGNREFIQFLSVSKGSIGEIRGHLAYADDTGLITSEQQRELDALALDAARCTGGLMRYLQSTALRGAKFRSRNDSR